MWDAFVQVLTQSPSGTGAVVSTMTIIVMHSPETGTGLAVSTLNNAAVVQYSLSRTRLFWSLAVPTCLTLSRLGMPARMFAFCWV